ncbi:MAG: zinc ribbon domain-containing protein [Chloroflexota bacterium]
MPTYPYQCKNCHHYFNLIQSYQDYGESKVYCPNCGEQNITRMLARVRFARSEESRLDSIADPSTLTGIEDDPKAMGTMMRKMTNEFGGELGDGGSDAEASEIINRLEAGQSPEQIEKDLPDLGGSGDSPL